MNDIGWFSTGRGEGSLGLLQTVQDAILRGELDARIRFIFSNRDPGEAEGSDRFFQKARDYDIPLVTFSSQGFRRSRGGGPFSRHRLEFDREVMKQLEGYEPEHVRAGRIHAYNGHGAVATGTPCSTSTQPRLTGR